MELDEILVWVPNNLEHPAKVTCILSTNLTYFLILKIARETEKWNEWKWSEDDRPTDNECEACTSHVSDDARLTLRHE